LQQQAGVRWGGGGGKGEEGRRSRNTSNLQDPKGLKRHHARRSSIERKAGEISTFEKFKSE
jgi:hypothetical protein